MAAAWRSELVDLARAASGGLVFGIPLLYTMEIWWVGSHTDPEALLLLLAILFLPILALMSTAGFRTVREVRLSDAAGDSVEALAIGLVVTTVVLVVLRRVTLDTPMTAVLGRVVNESIPFCLGVAVARFMLQGDRSVDEGDEDEDDEVDEDGAGDHEQGGGDEPDRSASPLRSDVADVGATALGAAFIALSIAPTDEVPMLAGSMSPAWLLLVVGVSLAASYMIVFVADFAGQQQRHGQRGVFQHPVTETVVSYLVGLAVAAVLLAVFRRELSPGSTLLGQSVVLGLPAAVGGAVGRLAI